MQEFVRWGIRLGYGDGVIDVNLKSRNCFWQIVHNYNYSDPPSRKIGLISLSNRRPTSYVLNFNEKPKEQTGLTGVHGL